MNVRILKKLICWLGKTLQINKN